MVPNSLFLNIRTVAKIVPKASIIFLINNHLLKIIDSIEIKYY